MVIWACEVIWASAGGGTSLQPDSLRRIPRTLMLEKNGLTKTLLCSPNAPHTYMCTHRWAR